MLKRNIIVVAYVAGCLSLGGCQRAGNNAVDLAAEDHNLRPESETLVSETLASDTVWDRIEMAGQPVGYQAMTLTKSKSDAGWVRDGRARSKIIVRRFGQSTTEEMQLASRDAGDGNVLRVEARILSGDSEQHTTGRRVGDRMHWQTVGAGKPQSWETALPSECGGFFAIEWSLRQSPMQPGERRHLHAIVPVINQVADIQLAAASHDEQTEHKKSLLQIDQTLTLTTGGSISSRLFANSNGEIMRSEMAAMQQVSYRTNRKHAMAAGGGAEFDLGGFASVPLGQSLVGGHTAKQAVYRIQMANDDPTKFFPATEGQQSQSIDTRTIEITVTRVRPRVAGRDSLAVSPTTLAACLASSALIQPDDERVQGMAAEIKRTVEQRAGEPVSDWELACEIERFVHDVVETKDFSTALASSAEVARSRQGDCTEHAVLTAAICRANKLPARVLIGLVHVAAQNAFVFHMWNEVLIGQRWIPLDATLGQGGTGAAHLIVARSDLASDTAFTAFLPVMSVIGQLRIDLVDVQEQQ